MHIPRRAILAITTALATFGLSACSTYDDYGYGDRGYDDYGYGQRADYGAATGYENDGYGDYAYDGRDYAEDRWDDRGNEDGWDDEDRDYFGGAGGDILDPWLALTREGRAIVRTGFDIDGDARIREETADRANIWFRRYADTDRDMRLTDEEIRVALVQASRERGGYG